MRIVIIGAGPCGLGAAWRLSELEHDEWILFEKEDDAGGLASSFFHLGYTWDVGGHVQFSHYEYFDRVMDALLEEREWVKHERSSWIWVTGGFVPYPLQHNLAALSKADSWKCIAGLLESREALKNEVPANFGDWLRWQFGPGMCDLFFEPYNRKVWRFPLEGMDRGWIGDRVARVDVLETIKNVHFGEIKTDWGPNKYFRFPVRGGTGEIWRRCAKKIGRERLHFRREVLAIDYERKTLICQGQPKEQEWDVLITTAPLDWLMWQVGEMVALAATSTHVVGIGLAGKAPEQLASRNWIYFPGDEFPFYRMTVFSGYAESNAPAGCWSLMTETSEAGVDGGPDGRKHTREAVDALVKVGWIKREDVTSVWYRYEPYGYPVPTLKRDAEVERAMALLEARGIYSRGRFGAWKYEVSNQDHTFMQGVELVDRLLLGRPEKTVKGVV